MQGTSAAGKVYITWLIDLAVFQQLFSHITAASSTTHVFPDRLTQILHTTDFSKQPKNVGRSGVRSQNPLSDSPR